MKHILSKISVASLVVLIAVQTILYLFRFGVVLLCNLPIDYEGPTYWGIYLLSRGGNIYDPSTLNAAPYMVTIYPPLYYGLAALFQPLLDFSSGLKMARLLSIFSLLASAFFSYRIFFLAGAQRIKAWIGTFAFLNFFALWIWSSYCRVDLLAVALALFGLERFLQAEKTAQGAGKNRLITLSIILSVAAVYTKQSSFVVPVSIICYLILQKRYRESGIWSLSCLSLSVLIFIGLQYATAGGFVQHMQFASSMPFEWKMLNEHLTWIGLDWLKILVMCAAILVLVVSGRKPQKESEPEIGVEYFQLIIPFLALTTGFTLYTLGTEYPNTNHAILFFFVLSWLFCQVTSLFKEKFDSQCEQIYSLTLIVVCLICCGFTSFLVPAMAYWPAQLNKAAIEEMKYLSMSPKNTLVFTEDPYLCLVSNTKPLFVDVSTFVQVWKSKKGVDWDKELSDMTSNKKFTAVIINSHDDLKEKPFYYWRESLVESIHQHYCLKIGITANRQSHNFYLPAD